MHGNDLSNLTSTNLEVKSTKLSVRTASKFFLLSKFFVNNFEGLPVLNDAYAILTGVVVPAVDSSEQGTFFNKCINTL